MFKYTSWIFKGQTKFPDISRTSRPSRLDTLACGNSREIYGDILSNLFRHVAHGTPLIQRGSVYVLMHIVQTRANCIGCNETAGEPNVSANASARSAPGGLNSWGLQLGQCYANPFTYSLNSAGQRRCTHDGGKRRAEMEKLKVGYHARTRAYYLYTAAATEKKTSPPRKIIAGVRACKLRDARRKYDIIIKYLCREKRSLISSLNSAFGVNNSRFSLFLFRARDI